MTDEHDSALTGAGDSGQPLTDDQVRASARPGESWEQARRRLELARSISSDGPVYASAGDVPFDDWSGLTIGQVAALAAPGETWEDGRDRAYRLHNCVTPCEPCPVCNHDGARRWGGWIDEPGYGCGACAAAASHARKLPHSF